MVRSQRRIFLNAGNVTGSGASVLVANLLPELYAAAPDAEFITLVPDAPSLTRAAAAANARVLTRPRRRGAWNDLNRLLELHGGLFRAVRASRADVCLTLGDLGPGRLLCPHVVFLHNPLFVYSRADLAGQDGWSPPKRRYMLWQFRRSLAAAREVIVQTPVMRSRLAASLGGVAAGVHIISQPVPRHVAAGAAPPGRSPIARCDKPIRLLFLAAHYPHKNHAILPAVVAEVRARGLGDSIQIFVTLGDQAPASLRTVLAASSDLVTDLGPLPPTLVPEAMADASALFLPTLLESYGLIYLEAMACGLPILTSERDFARWICSDVAQYFDPLSPRSIVDAIVALPKFVRETNVGARARARLSQLPSGWPEVGARFVEVLRRACSPLEPVSPASPSVSMFPGC
jgi:glycosyltransferase involved in cell wall biosynthesis